jgi:hypothetical protein
MLVSLFQSVTTPHCPQTVAMESLIADIRGGRWRREVELARIEYAQHGKSARYGALKERLPCFTPAGRFSHRSTRGLIEASGVVQIDLDGLNPRQIARALDALRNDPYTVYCFLSPGAGVKAGMHIPTVYSDDEYRPYFWGICHCIRRTHGFMPDES